MKCIQPLRDIPRGTQNHITAVPLQTHLGYHQAHTHPHTPSTTTIQTVRCFPVKTTKMPGRQLPTPDFAINTVDEKDPLLPGEKSGGEEGHGGGSAFNAFFTMASACAGAGILSLPMAASSIGVLPVVLTLVVFGGINSFTLWVSSFCLRVCKARSRSGFVYFAQTLLPYCPLSLPLSLLLSRSRSPLLWCRSRLGDAYHQSVLIKHV